MKQLDQIKLISLDLDGTLLNNASVVSPYTYECLKKAHDEGILIVMNSGRPFKAVEIAIKPIDFYDYIVCMNGQCIFDRKNNQFIEREKLKKEDILKLHAMANKYFTITNYHDDALNINASTKSHYPFTVIFNSLQSLKWIGKQAKGQKRIVTTNLESIEMHDVGKICFAGFYHTLKKVRDEARKMGYSSIFVAPQWLEVQGPNISKGIALKEIMKKENITPDNCIAFGDGENDIEMLQACTYRIAMKNAMPNTKKIATDICGHHNQDGVAKYLYAHVLKD